MASNRLLVIGAGPAGLEAAKGAADMGTDVLLVEATGELGGTPYAHYATLTPYLKETQDAMQEMLEGVKSHPSIDIRYHTRVTASQGEAGNFQVTLAGEDGTETQESVGAVVVATGFQHFDPGRETQLYGYYEFDDVITLVDAEHMMKSGKIVRPSNGQPPEQVAFIQCVGSRDRQIGNRWCSKVCCGIASKQSIEIKRMLPDAKVFIFYIDMRMYGFWEDQLYWKAQEEYKVNYVRGIVTEILKKGDKLLMKGEDTTMGRPVEVLMDLIILSVGMEPSKGTLNMAQVFNIPRESHGFLATQGEPLDTVTTPVPGVYVAGAAAGPKDIEDSVSMGGAAAVKAVGLLTRLAKTTA